MKEFWDKRYASTEFVYGREPNRFFRESVDELGLKGRILLPAEGEGRNAIYAAKKGLSVFAFDISEQARLKALQFAKDEQLEIVYRTGTIGELELEGASFDAAAITFAHMPPQMRVELHRQVAECLRPGGTLILEGFSKSHLPRRLKDPKAGGPDKEDFLFSMDEILSDFPELDIVKLEEYETQLDEGRLHQGPARVIRFIGTKKP